MGVISYKVGDRWYRFYAEGRKEEFELKDVMLARDEKKSKDDVVYGFETFIDGAKSCRPMFHMRAKYLTDLISIGAWKSL